MKKIISLLFLSIFLLGYAAGQCQSKDQNILILSSMESNNSTIMVTDLSGRIILNQENTSLVQGQNYLSFPKVSKGIYLVSIIHGDNVITKKVVNP